MLMKSMVVNKRTTGVLFSICSSLRARTTSVASGQRRLLPMMVFWTLAKRNCMPLTGRSDTSASFSSGCTISSTKSYSSELFIYRNKRQRAEVVCVDNVFMSIAQLVTVRSLFDSKLGNSRKITLCFVVLFVTETQ